MKLWYEHFDTSKRQKKKFIQCKKIQQISVLIYISLL